MECLKASEIMIDTLTKSLSDDQIISSVGRHHGFMSYSDGLRLDALRTAHQVLASDESLVSSGFGSYFMSNYYMEFFLIRQIKSHKSESALRMHANGLT